MRSERGFTMIELLIVVLIIGILAAIALPQFTGQRKLAMDASAKSQVRAGAAATEAIAVDGEAFATTRAQLLAAAPELDQAPSWTYNASATSYELTVTSTSGHAFTIARQTRTSPMRRTCTGSGGCRDGVW